jgi:hypothetical protein
MGLTLPGRQPMLAMGGTSMHIGLDAEAAGIVRLRVERAIASGVPLIANGAGAGGMLKQQNIERARPFGHLPLAIALPKAFAALCRKGTSPFTQTIPAHLRRA